jgi:hypothetical protein
MHRFRFRHLKVAALLVGLLAAGTFAAVGVSAKAPAAAGAQQVRMTSNDSFNLKFNLQRFQIDRQHHRLVANGNVVGTFRSNGQVMGTTTRRTTLAVSQASTCSVLHLELGQLRLQLLGLIVSLTPVNASSIVLDISANSNEALGKLFCQVLQSVQGASTTTTAATTKATRKLSKVVASRYQNGVMNVNVPLTPAAAAATTTSATTTTTAAGPAAGQCEVLDLILGPLNLDLLGLVVQLNEVELNVSANPVGTLGTLFCQLAGNTAPPTTTAPATTTGP